MERISAAASSAPRVRRSAVLEQNSLTSALSTVRGESERITSQCLTVPATAAALSRRSSVTATAQQPASAWAPLLLCHDELVSPMLRVDSQEQDRQGQPQSKHAHHSVALPHCRSHVRAGRTSTGPALERELRCHGLSTTQWRDAERGAERGAIRLSSQTAPVCRRAAEQDSASRLTHSACALSVCLPLLDPSVACAVRRWRRSCCPSL